MSKIQTIIETNTHEDADGNITIDKLERTTAIEKSTEPDFVKLYTKMWCEFNNIPIAYRQLFTSMVCRMSYCNSHDLKHSQLVNTAQPWADAFLDECHWTSIQSLRKGLKALCDCGAIKKVGRGVYQINPSYAGKGNWHYNPRLDQGGIKDLVATFNFKDKTVDTQIVWADNGENTDENQDMREILDTTAKEQAILSTTKITPVESVETPAFITELEKDAEQQPKKKRGRPKKNPA